MSVTPPSSPPAGGPPAGGPPAGPPPAGPPVFPLGDLALLPTGPASSKSSSDSSGSESEMGDDEDEDDSSDDVDSSDDDEEESIDSAPTSSVAGGVGGGNSDGDGSAMGGDEDEMIRDYLIQLEDKINKMKLESALASVEDARFIDQKIKEMEEFLIESKLELGFTVDTDMKEAKESKKRELGAGFASDVEEESSRADEDAVEPASKRH